MYGNAGQALHFHTLFYFNTTVARLQAKIIENATALRTIVTGIPIRRGTAVDRPCQDLGTTGLTGTPGPAEQIGMRNIPVGDLRTEGLDDMLLPHHVRKGQGAVFTIKSLIHSFSSNQQ